MSNRVKIVAWNCCRGLDKKFPDLIKLEPSLAVVSECAEIDILRSKAPLFCPKSAVWIGHDKNQGLGVFGFKDYQVELDACYDPSIPWIAPVQVSGPQRFHLLAVCALHSREPGETKRDVVGPLLRALNTYSDFISAKPLVVAGDFNNNVVWDEPGKLNNHANVVSRLDMLGLVSAYHSFHGIAQGDEVDPTLYHTKSREKPFHIDYCFVPKSWVINDFMVGSPNEWLSRSDHMPLFIEATVPSVYDSKRSSSHPSDMDR